MRSATRIYGGWVVPALKLALLTPLLLAAPARSNAAPDSQSGAGSFTAKLELKALKNDKTGRVPQLPFSGSYAHAAGRFRMELVNDLTTESQILILDSQAKRGWMLFPDTLNGITADLAALDSKGLLGKLQGVMSGGAADTPKDWGKPTSKSTTLNGQAVTELSYSLPSTKAGGQTVPGGTMTIWQRADKSPARLVFDSDSMKLSVDFTKSAAAKLDASQFKPDAKFKLRELGKGETPPLPGGLPSGLI